MSDSVREGGSPTGFEPRHFASGLLVATGLGAFTALYLWNAWVLDDAYITFRTVDNLLNGHGLRWNVDERVQTYTHPLWMFLMAAAAAVSGEVFYTSVAVSLACVLAAFVLAARVFASAGDPVFRTGLFVLCFTASKSVFDYSSSGLENPLLYLLMAAFWLRFPFNRDALGRQRARDFALLCALFSLSFLVRPDAVLMFAPAVAWVGLSILPRLGWRAVLLAGLIGALPALAWVAFSLFYYGFPLPNTYYAKSGRAGVPLEFRMARGLRYYAGGIRWDAFGFLMLGLALAVAVWRRSAWGSLALAGAGLALAYTLTTAATATHMGLRFFAAPLFTALLVYCRLAPGRALPAAAACAAIAALAFSPVSPLRIGGDRYDAGAYDKSMIDTKLHVHRGGAALRNRLEHARLPAHHWYTGGLAFREAPERVSFGGKGRSPAVGYFSYAAGPEKFIIDYCGLCDPLLARLPPYNTATPWDLDTWQSGHFRRRLPAGYRESVRDGENRIAHPELRQWYDKLTLVTRGPLWSWERLRAVVAMNLGQYDVWLDAYALDTAPPPGR